MQKAQLHNCARVGGQGTKPVEIVAMMITTKADLYLFAETNNNIDLPLIAILSTSILLILNVE